MPNRQALSDRLSSAILRAQRSDDRLAVLYIDLDNFNAINDINDCHGHGAGDEVLRQIAARLQSCIRAADTAARLTGGEFVVLLEGIAGPTDTRNVAAKILSELTQPIRFEDSIILKK